MLINQMKQHMQQLDHVKIHDWVCQMLANHMQSPVQVAPVSEWQLLPGGTSTIVAALTAVSQDVAKTPVENTYILRLVNNESWLEEEPDLAAHEAASLRLAHGAGLAAPQLIGYDLEGSQCGLPAVLMTKLPGRIVLQPGDTAAWIDGMARTIAAIHQVEADDFAWRFFPYMDMASFEVPAWSAYPKAWAEAIALVQSPAPAYRPCFIHRDFHPANVLWQTDDDGACSGAQSRDNGIVVSGVVDWVNACAGPAGFDIGHCRVDLAKLHGLAMSDAFLDTYMTYAEEAFNYHPYWDLLALIDVLFGPPDVYQGWIDLGVTHLTDDMMIKRVDEYMLSLLRRYEAL